MDAPSKAQSFFFHFHFNKDRYQRPEPKDSFSCWNFSGLGRRHWAWVETGARGPSPLRNIKEARASSGQTTISPKHFQDTDLCLCLRIAPSDAAGCLQIQEQVHLIGRRRQKKKKKFCFYNHWFRLPPNPSELCLTCGALGVL